MSSKVLTEARKQSSLTQRRLAQLAGTAQSVVARIELGDTAPTTETLERLVRAAGFELSMAFTPLPVLDPQILDDVPRILRLSPEARLREIGNIDRLVASARRV